MYNFYKKLASSVGLSSGANDQQPAKQQQMDVNYNKSSDGIVSSENMVANTKFLLSPHDYVCEKTIQCPICADYFIRNEVYECPCEMHHIICYNCLINEIENQNTDDVSYYCCPACGSDKHEKLGCQDIAYIYGRGDPFCPEAFEAKMAYDKKLFTFYSRLISVKCANKYCEGKCDLPQDIQASSSGIFVTDIKKECICPLCKYSTCPICKDFYHYGMDCNTKDKIVKDYKQWERYGRDSRHFEKMSDEERKNNFEKAQKNFANELKIIEENYKNECLDEEDKSRSCKYCPHCHRVIRKEGGCDDMICGRNWHGGNIQDGCGADFKWSKAEAYIPDIPKKRVIYFNEKKPKEMVLTNHDDKFYCCMCGVCPIRGYRFKCINCLSFYICEQCEFDEHEKHCKGQHIFKLINDPHEV
ncbi:hypothetical protein WA158_002897 [Blastocystis sp. Blastoise]